MALGFKVADGYVEVHARYDKGELRRAAEQAADDSDTAFNKERVRNAKSSDTRGTNRKIGGLASEDFVRGMREQIARQKQSSIISVDNVRRDATNLGRVHVAEFGKSVDEEVARRRTVFRNIGRRISDRIAGGLVGSGGAARGAAAFLRNFTEAITLGQADFGRVMTTGLASSMARVGTAVGVGFAVAFVARAAQAIVALLPLALGGALLAAPIIALIAKNTETVKGKLKFLKTEIGNALKGFVTAFKKLGDALGRVFSGTFLAMLENAARAFEALAKPMQRAIRAITPGGFALFMGFLDGIFAFGKAMKPALPGINAGLKEWGKQLPRIFKAIGEAFSGLLKDPDKVKSSVKATSDLIIGLIGLLADVIGKLTELAIKYDDLATQIDTDPRTGKKTEGNKDSFAAIGKLATQNFVVAKLDAWSDMIKKKIVDLAKWIASGALTRAIKKMVLDAVAAVAGFGDKIAAKLEPLRQKMNAKAEAAVKAVEKWFKSLPGRVAAAVSTTGREVAAAFSRSAGQVVKTVSGLVKKVVDWFKSLPGKTRVAVATLPAKLMGPFNTAAAQAAAKARDLVAKVIAFVKTLPGKARSAVARLWSSMAGAFTSAVSNAKAKGKALVTGFINALKAIVAKARAQVTATRNAIKAGFAGAGSWLVSAGRAIISGLAQGIRSGASIVVNAAITAAKAALGAAKRALGIKSPSTVFAEQVGKPIAQGIGVGVKKQMPDEMKDLAKLLPRAPGGMSSGRAGRGYETSSTFSPTINVHVAAGLDPIDAAARRALVKGLWLETEKFRKDYVR